MAGPNDGPRHRKKAQATEWQQRIREDRSKSGRQAGQKQSSLTVSPLIVFCILLVAHTVGALYHPIQDCDETFNYWEPTHFLVHGHGFQTWEYSPEYAIRSWTYAGIHAILSLPGKLSGSKTIEFYSVRFLLGLFCAACETRLCSKISKVLNPRVGILFLIILATSPGMLHASVAYLPSSFSMYTTMLGTAAFMDWISDLRTAQGIFWIGAGACLGWPFAAAMAAPFLLEEAVLAWTNRAQILFIQRMMKGSGLVLVVLAVQTAIDCFFYQKLVCVPFNIVWYNVLSGKGGPDLYGTEPWHFYFRNLALNFHIWFLLAVISLPLLILHQVFRDGGIALSGRMRGIVFLSPFYVWLAIFTLQPHKEERFMYPAYPALALNAAVAMHIISTNVTSRDRATIASKFPLQLRIFALAAIVQAALMLSIFRSMGTITAYNAPLEIYQPLHRQDLSKPGNTVCLGKEWYRFPTHYLLPSNVRAKFIRSEFNGLLPGHFSEQNISWGILSPPPGTWQIPVGMNDENIGDESKYTELKHCNFVVDSRAPSTIATSLEPSFIADFENWERIKCLPFLDSGSTGILGRLGWIPDLPFVPERFRRVWGEQCLLKRRKRQIAGRMYPVPVIETLG